MTREIASESTRQEVSPSMLRDFLRVLLVASAFAIVGCSKDELSGRAKTEDCDQSIPAPGKAKKLPHPKEPTACLLVVEMCNYCEYKPDGSFDRAGSEACGVCVGADF